MMKNKIDDRKNNDHVSLIHIFYYYLNKMSYCDRDKFQNHIKNCYKCGKFFVDFDEIFDQIFVSFLNEIKDESKDKILETIFDCCIKEIKETSEF